MRISGPLATSTAIETVSATLPRVYHLSSSMRSNVRLLTQLTRPFQCHAGSENSDNALKIRRVVGGARDHSKRQSTDNSTSDDIRRDGRRHHKSSHTDAEALYAAFNHNCNQKPVCEDTNASALSQRSQSSDLANSSSASYIYWKSVPLELSIAAPVLKAHERYPVEDIAVVRQRQQRPAHRAKAVQLLR